MLASDSHLHRRLAVPVVLSIGTCLLSSFVYKLRKRQRATPLRTRAAACVVHNGESAALSDLLTVIVTTSPIPSNPDMSMLNYLLESLQKVIAIDFVLLQHTFSTLLTLLLCSI
jgi:hypothetical protein